LQSQRVVHRDIKLENWLYANNEQSSPVLITDFGMAAFYDESVDEPLTSMAGSSFYVAPEVLKQSYGNQCDMWSIGVTAYMLLSGVAPFGGEDITEILNQVMSGRLNFPNKYFRGTTQEAKDFLRYLLTRTVMERPGPSEALAHPWLRKRSSVHAGPDAAHELWRRSEIVDSLEAFSAADGLAKIALEVMAFTMPPAKLDELRHVFQKMDTDGSGTLSLDEFRQAMALHREVPSERVEQIFTQMDVAHHGEVDYTEFLAATLDKKAYMQEDVCWSAFRVFDRNGDGKISMQELEAVLASGNVEEAMGASAVKELMKEVDTNGDGEIDFQEFMQMMRKQEGH